MNNLGRYNLLGVQVTAIDYDGALREIISAAQERRTFGVSALAVHGIMTGFLDSTHRYRLNDLEMIVPDGQPVRWGLNLLHGLSLKERVYGPTLMLLICKRAAEEGIPIFLFGGSADLLERLKQKLTARYPDLKIAGARPSKFRKISLSEKQELIEEIRGSNAGITFVGLGCPRQEVWTFEFRRHLSMPVLAVGAAFNFHAGLLPQAPLRLQALGLEWFYRLAKEPSRLWKRYLFLNPLYLAMLFLQWSDLRRFDSSSTIAPTSEHLYG